MVLHLTTNWTHPFYKTVTKQNLSPHPVWLIINFISVLCWLFMNRFHYHHFSCISNEMNNVHQLCTWCSKWFIIIIKVAVEIPIFKTFLETVSYWHIKFFWTNEIRIDFSKYFLTLFIFIHISHCLLISIFSTSRHFIICYFIYVSRY